ncbi:hypothetical protein NE237_032073 [Protea cynaroides]|uniref:Uncharacterized protein n=1 Tax=Protea cynaroides TaxID=273540 RepID=A0A9Q0L2U0_9MAGN|nr:hypothetical protein NE237_032073 [Protea cynaroides]
MTFLLQNFSPSLSVQAKSKEKFIRQISVSKSTLSPLLLSSSPLTKLEIPPLRRAPDNDVPRTQDKEKNDLYVKLGLAVRTLREDLDDTTFMDPLNTFTGIENYKLISWALRFHSRILFREIALEVHRVWQPSENVILIRWNLRGVPRVPWEATGQFEGTSRYKVDRNGKIYEHKVNNLVFNFPQSLGPAKSVLDFVAACPASSNLTFLWESRQAYTSAWTEFYSAVRETLYAEGHLFMQDGLVMGVGFSLI